MNDDFCVCKDWLNIKEHSPSVFQWKPPYGWVLIWTELSKERAHTQAHSYGIRISFCPMCGKKLQEISNT